ncbi:unnamed protein product, partial [Closterium sp. NIES-54]
SRPVCRSLRPLPSSRTVAATALQPPPVAATALQPPHSWPLPCSRPLLRPYPRRRRGLCPVAGPIAALPCCRPCRSPALPCTRPCRAAPPIRAAPPAKPRRPKEPRRPTEPHCPALAAPAATAAMASPTVLTFDAEGRAVDFDVWVDDLQLFLQCDSRDGVSLFDHTSGVSTAPAATADIARYSSPATAARIRLMLPYLFPELAAFATAADLTAHLRTSDAHYPLPFSLMRRSELPLPLVGDAATASARGARVVEGTAGAAAEGGGGGGGGGDGGGGGAGSGGFSGGGGGGGGSGGGGGGSGRYPLFSSPCSPDSVATPLSTSSSLATVPIVGPLPPHSPIPGISDSELLLSRMRPNVSLRLFRADSRGVPPGSDAVLRSRSLSIISAAARAR